MGSNMAKTKITPAEDRLERFCREYTIDSNATRAATVAGYSPKTAMQQGSRLLRNVKVRTRIEQLQAEIATRNDITVDRVLRELGRIAFFDPRKLFDENGALKKIPDMDDDTAAVLASIDVDEITMGKGPDALVIGHTRKFKAFDKNTALGNAMRTLGLFKADNEQHTNPLKEMFDLINASRGRKGLI